ncbi:uncharacterized protein [Venturia canescens]|uniref:uncharacterized protein n=1 Tax=Venturia canescens TaxID=32260 RepID=UPI001C9BD1E8|nr:uncharacterized protein LOC122412995 [Venturia canescens]
MGEESGEAASGSPKLKKFLKEAPFFCKLIQLVMCVVSVGLIVDPFNNRMQGNFNHAGLIYIAVGGYILINAIFVICYLYGERTGPKISLMFSRLGAILCFAAGVVLIYDYKNFQNNYISRYHDQYLNQMLASGVFAILASVFFAIEMYFISKEEEEE